MRRNIVRWSPTGWVTVFHDRCEELTFFLVDVDYEISGWADLLDKTSGIEEVIRIHPLTGKRQDLPPSAWPFTDREVDDLHEPKSIRRV